MKVSLPPDRDPQTVGLRDPDVPHSVPRTRTMAKIRPNGHHCLPVLSANASARQGCGGQTEEAPPDPDRVPANASLIRALAVDDSPFILKTLSAFLERLAHIQLVGTAVDGYQAVRRVVELEPDLVLMDLQLPGISGLEATRRIKARSPATAVIMLTAEDTPECRAAASAAGTDGFVGKHHMFTQLPAAIRKLFPRNAEHRN
jgi:CheY-like chemotaxis protein